MNYFHTLFQGGCGGGVLKKSLGYTRLPEKKLLKKEEHFPQNAILE
jgi:hypothetical protein